MPITGKSGIEAPAMRAMRGLQMPQATTTTFALVVNNVAPTVAADNATVRSVFIIGPDKKIKAMLTYPMSTGRNFDEVLRVIDSLQLTAKHKVSTPVNWKDGDDVIIAGSVSNDEAKELFGEWDEPKPYIRIVPQPKG